MSALDALRRGVDNFPGVRAVVAVRLGKTDEVLRKELPGASSHKLGAVDALTISGLLRGAAVPHCHDYAAYVAHECGGRFDLLQEPAAGAAGPVAKELVYLFGAAGRGAVMRSRTAVTQPWGAFSFEASQPLLQAAGITLSGGGRSDFSVMDNPMVVRAFGGGQPVMTTSQVNVQNMDAADGLAAQGNIESMARLRASGQIAAPGSGSSMNISGGSSDIRHSGNDWAARKNLENLATGASSIMNRGGYAEAGMGRFRGGDQGGTPPAVSAYQSALQTDQALQQAGPGLQAEDLRMRNALVRAAMEQQGQNQRAGMQAGLQQQKLDMDRETQGFTNRRMGLVEYMRNQVAQEPSAVNRVPLIQCLRELEGTAQPDRWSSKVTPTVKNVDGSTSEGSAYRLNEATGQVERVPMGQAQGQQFQAGQVYVDGQGRRAKFNGTGWEPA